MFDFSGDHAASFKIGARKSGCGKLELSYVAGRTAVTRSVATNPLKILIPRRRTVASWVYTSTYGGGLVAGDEINLHLRVGSRAIGVVGTQASTKVYRSASQMPCRQSLHASVDDRGLLILAPDPVTCFAQARYEQSQTIHLRQSGSLVLVDWLTSGRRARGECWAFSRYRSQLQVFRDDKLILADALLLDPADGPLDSPFRLGRFHCLAMIVLIGDQLTAAIADQLDRIARKPIEKHALLVDVASPVPHGMILRVIGESTEIVTRYLTQVLGFLNNILGEGPWARKW